MLASVAAIASHIQLDLASRRLAYLLVPTGGAAAESEAASAVATVTALGGDAELTTDPVEGERLLALRRAVHPSLIALGTAVIEDVAVPRRKLAEMFEAIYEIEGRYGARIATVVHVGDGNLHQHFIFEGENRAGEHVVGCWRTLPKSAHARRNADRRTRRRYPQ